MNHHRWSAAMLLGSASLAACGPAEADRVSSRTRETVVEIGSAATDTLLATLVAHLTRAMEERGAVDAIEFCAANALPLTAEAAGRFEGLDLKRTSMLYRNPANAPDEAEAAALQHFETELAASGELPASWVQKVGRNEYRYYRPLTVGAPCLACHGEAHEIAPEVQAVLRDRYPDDRATGYAAGDFRGLVRVSIPAARVAAGGA